jgi:Icc-related predicted phosphoesterase
MVTICAISDLHGFLPGDRFNEDNGLVGPIEPVDCLLLAGDLLPVRDHSLLRQAAWLDGPFRKWLGWVPAKTIIAVAGNHDLVFEQAPHLVPQDLPWTYLQDGGAVLHHGDQMFTVYGSPWQPTFCNWSFNLDELELAQKWSLFPDQVDILLLHGPPRGYGDVASDGRPTGSPSLRERIDQVKPKLSVFGHIHEGRGVWRAPWGGILANVAIRNRCYRVIHEPMYFTIDDAGAIHHGLKPQSDPAAA